MHDLKRAAEAQAFGDGCNAEQREEDSKYPDLMGPLAFVLSRELFGAPHAKRATEF